MSNHFLFENPVALRAYTEGEAPSTETILRGIFVEDWRDNPFLPDHFLKNRRDFVLGLNRGSGGVALGSVALGEIIVAVLEYLSRRYLVWEHDRLFVREEHYGEWQDLLTRVSPLLLMAFSVHRHVGPPPEYRLHQEAYIDRWLLPNFRHTALPYPANR